MNSKLFLFYLFFTLFLGVLSELVVQLEDTTSTTITNDHDDVADVSAIVDGSCQKSSCGAEQYLSSSHHVDGFHVVCIAVDMNEADKLNVEVYFDGHDGNRMDLEAPAVWQDLRRELEVQLQLETLSGSNPSNKYPWEMYTSNGILINSLEQMLDTEVIFIFKGGVFIWPGISIGHTYTITNLTGIDTVMMTTISMQPLVFEVEHFLTLEECEHIKTVATPMLRPSPVSKMDHDQDKPSTYWRTSHNCFVPSGGDTILEHIDNRVQDLTKIPKRYQEWVQVLRYEHGQRYSAHHDYFPPEHYQSEGNAHIMQMIDNGRLNRVVTVFWYLSNVEVGGETIFPQAGGDPSIVDFNSCEKGLKVKPQKGKVIMFYSMKPDAQFDEFSLHGACPVEEGTKWAANKWVWSRPILK